MTGLAPGDLVFAEGNHAPWQCRPSEKVVPVPKGRDPSIAVFTRLIGVSSSTLTTTAARPADAVC